MIIRRLVLHNFGLYAETNEFQFKGKKPIVLIGGLNGRGKTTFLNAILLSLYGANSFAYKESKYNTFGQYLKSYVNTADGTNQTYIEIEFVIDKVSKDKYIVRREWNGNKARISDKVTVLKNNEYDAFLTENWDMYIESIIPSALSNFFFFDGEQIADLATDETNDQIKKSIKSLLGINVIDTLQKDIGRVNNNVRKTLGAKLNQKEADRLKDNLNNANELLTTQSEIITSANKELESLKQKLEELETAYRVNGGEAYESEEDQREKKTELQSAINQLNQNLAELAGGIMPLALLPNLIDAIDVYSRKETKAEVNRIAVEQIKEYAEMYPTDESINSFIDFIVQKSKETVVSSRYGLSQNARYGVSQLNASLIDEAVKDARKILKEKASKQKKLDEIENYLSLDIDGSKIGKIAAQKKNKEIEISKAEESIRIMQEELTTLHGNQMKASAEYNRFIEKELEVMGTSEDSERILKYTALMDRVFEKYKIRLQENKLSELATTITACYKKLANKGNLIDKVEIDSVTLNFYYFDKYGSEVNKASLSAGEKQLMVVCILWGLAICSKKKLPVIIDTPLGRMDSNHRSALIKKYFPKASEQTIILSTDTEIDRNYYEMMKPNIGDEFTLIYDDEAGSTSIHHGYLFGEE